ncbi:tetratricopeptide repeat protein [Streptomyces sp. PanSC19]|uniref:tetratricopeptide repeat protein n=1 Tax=Streptomyces sp. PanSC19 TaxID=1520455 RepID=UPI000F468687|nr:tetratricopeptide repeat protein [Streptomyces sp. PanSC19]ROQ34504.1 tetratricopeptide repeat protein [Streptomyces sp. PanSC19]
MSAEQHVTAHSGYAYGVIGADIHVFGDGSPVYLLQNWRRAPAADPEWLRELPSRMLNARFEVVPFTGRDAELAELRAWRDQGPRLAVRWLHAPGGQGKTRLAARFADATQDEGWRVAAATHGPGSVQPPPGSQDLTTEGRDGVLLVVDYADRWPLTHLTWLFGNALLHRPGVRARVLLLARTADAWPAIRASLANLQAGTSSMVLEDLPDGPGMYRAARDAFAVRYGVTAAPEPPPPYGLTLALHMAALVSVDARAHGRRPPDDLAGLTVYLLDREHLHWGTLFARGDGPYATPPEAMNRAVFAAALTGAVDRSTGSAVVAGLGTGGATEGPGPSPAPGLSPDRLLDDHAFCYPAAEPQHGTVLEPLYPDRLAEDFLALTLPGHGADYPATAWAPEVTARLLGPHAGRAVTFLAAAAQRWPHLGPRHLYPLLTADPGLALAAGGAALSTLAALDDIPVPLLSAVGERFPVHRHVDLDAGIAAVTQRIVSELLALDDGPAARATGYHHLSTRLSHAGRLDEALEAARLALAAQEELPEDVPALATALARLGNCLALTGRPEEAVTVTGESAALFGRLAEAEPTARWDAMHAGLLNDLAIWLSLLGRHQEALAVGEQSVADWRRIVAAEPVHEEHLAGALHGLGNYLSSLGRWAEAADVTGEAMRIRTRLAERDPSAHEPDLAKSLVNQANHLAAQGRRAEALELSRQAVTVLRSLARANAAAHEPDLALALTSLGADLAEAGRVAEAVDATAEAVAIRRRLASGNLAAHAPGLGQSVSNLAYFLLGAGRPAEALAAAEEAVSLRERLYAEHPDPHRADLAQSLSNLGMCLESAGRRAEGLAATRRAVELYRAAHAGNPAAYAFDLARVLNNLGHFLALDRRWEEALVPVVEAIALAERSAAANPPAYGALLEHLRQTRDGCLRMLGR